MYYIRLATLACTSGAMALGVAATAAWSQSATITFDDVVTGQQSFAFDGDSDGTPDAVFTTPAPDGFNTVGPGAQQAFIDEPGLEASSLPEGDIQIDFEEGASDFLSFGFAVNSSIGGLGSGSLSVFDADGNQIGNGSIAAESFRLPDGRSSRFPENELFVSFDGTADFAVARFQSEFGRFIIDNFDGTFGSGESDFFDSRFLLATVASASEGPPSAGTALGRLTNKRMDSYATKVEAAERCASTGQPPGCDPNALRRAAMDDVTETANDVGRVGVEVVVETSGAGVKSAAVDTTGFAATRLGQLINLAEITSFVGGAISDGLDFLRATRESEEEEDAPQLQSAVATD